jgi:hypothetical protein
VHLAVKLVMLDEIRRENDVPWQPSPDPDSQIEAHRSSESAHTRNPFEFQRHGPSDSEAHSCECNDGAILNSLKGRNLGFLLVPNFEELLFDEENAGGSAGFCGRIRWRGGL